MALPLVSRWRKLRAERRSLSNLACSNCTRPATSSKVAGRIVTAGGWDGEGGDGWLFFFRIVEPGWLREGDDNYFLAAPFGDLHLSLALLARGESGHDSVRAGRQFDIEPGAGIVGFDH